MIFSTETYNKLKEEIQELETKLPLLKEQQEETKINYDSKTKNTNKQKKWLTLLKEQQTDFLSSKKMRISLLAGTFSLITLFLSCTFLYTVFINLITAFIADSTLRAFLTISTLIIGTISIGVLDTLLFTKLEKIATNRAIKKMIETEEYKDLSSKIEKAKQRHYIAEQEQEQERKKLEEITLEYNQSVKKIKFKKDFIANNTFEFENITKDNNNLESKISLPKTKTLTKENKN